MLVSLKWLRDYVDYGNKSVDEMAELLTKLGLEVDGVEYIAKEKSENIVAGYVKTCEQHPNADKLNLCEVDIGEDDNLQIICGANNIDTGQKVVVAKPGAVLPGDFKIKQVKLRGIESNGMICSLQELSVADKFVAPEFAEGIIVLPEETEIGSSVDELLNLDDVVLDIDLTPNRADALNMLGVAYDVSAIVDSPVKYPEVNLNRTEESAKDYIKVSVAEESIAPYYGATIIKNVKVGPSPIWMQNRLLAAGIRPINNVVDITNYVLIEYGQPLHAFDYDLLGSKEIIVRRAEDDEVIKTLDGKTRTLNMEHMVITNGKEPVAIAGVMGGADSEVNDETTTILLEAAYFDRNLIRNAVNHTGLRSEASNRFEKGVDPNRVQAASDRAASLLSEYANGQVLKDTITFDQLDISEEELILNTTKLNARLGTEINNREIETILTKLGFAYESSGDDYTISIPTRRLDVSIFEDMVEEIARIYGYDNIPYTLPENASKPGRLSDAQLLKRKIKSYLESVGLTETITYSLVSKKQTETLLSPDIEAGEYIPVPLAMPLSEDHQYLRLSQLPELLNRLTHNAARKQTDLALYEAGSIFLNKEKDIQSQPEEQGRLTGALTGLWINHKWQNEKKPIDFYLVKGIIEGLANYLAIEIEFKQAVIADMHPGRAATLHVNDKLIGFMGQIHPSLAKEKDLKETFVFDLNLTYLLEIKRPELLYTPIPKYPSILRDIAVIVEDSVQAGDIQTTIKAAGKPLVKQVEAFDVYTGEGLETNEKSIAFNLHYQDPEKTLTDAEVDASFEEVIEAIKSKHNAKVRN